MPRKNARSGASGAGTGGAADRREDSTQLEERILQGIFQLYTRPSQVSSAFRDMLMDGQEAPGIEDIAREVGGTSQGLLHPSRKVSVMIVGNHSAGKSSFVNWYAGETGLLNTGMAVESQGFTVVTSGERKDTIQGEPALQMKPHFAGLAKFENVLPRFHVQTSTSRNKDFSNVDLIDTPGLLDADSAGGGYPFDVNEVILYLAARVDMVLIFMDPIGQALRQRTMRIVRALDEANMSEKVHYYLTKADEIHEARDLTKVVTQTAGALAKHLTTQHGMDVGTIWIPGLRHHGGEGEANPENNQIGTLCDKINQAVRRKVQSNLTLAKNDCDQVSADIEQELVVQAERRETKGRWWRHQLFLLLFVLPIILSVSFIDILMTFEAKLPVSVVDSPIFKAVSPYLRTDAPFGYLVAGLETAGLKTVWMRAGAAAVAFLFFEAMRQFLAWRSRRLPTRDAAGLQALSDYRDVLATAKTMVSKFTTEYVQHAQAPEYQR